MARATKCPQCGEPVSPFAAGCAICGADLEAHRAQLAARRSPRDAVPLPTVRLPRVDDDVLLLALAALLVALAPLLGVLLALFGAHNPRFANVRTWLYALALIGLALTFVPALRFGVAGWL